MINPKDTKIATHHAVSVAIGRGFPERHLSAMGDGVSHMTCEQLECLSVARKCLRADAGCMVHGKTGSGKTMLAAWLGRQSAIYRRPSHYWTLSDLMMAQKEWFGDKRFDKPVSPFSVARSTYLLVIDEIRANSGSLFDHNELNSIIDARYRDLKATVLITNIRPEKMIEVFSHHTLDRLRDGGGIIELKGNSMRGQSA